MKFTASFSSGKLVLYLVGELDHHAAKEVMDHIGREIDLNLPRDCVIDMDKLSFMDSSGIAVVMGTYKRMNHIGGRCWVINAGRQPMKVLTTSGIYRLVNIKESVG